MTGTLCSAMVVSDIAMPLLNGMEAMRQILHGTPSVKVTILSARNDDTYIENVVESSEPLVISSRKRPLMF